MIKKTLLFILSFLVIYSINFFLPRLMPGDPFRYTSALAGEDLDRGYSEEQIRQLQMYYGLDQPLLNQFISTIVRNLHGDLGQSIHYKKPVRDILLQRLPWSLGLMLTALLASLAAGIALALICVRNRSADRLFYGLLSVFGEIPAFLLGILLLFFVAAQTEFFPISGGQTAFADYLTAGQRLADLLRHGALPALALILVILPSFFFTARASFLDILRKPYLEQARAKGISERLIRWRYILPNGITPVITRFFLGFAAAIGGTIMVENVFAYPGIGRVLRDAVSYRDFPMIQGVFLLSSVLVLTSLYLADLINRRMDGDRR